MEYRHATLAEVPDLVEMRKRQLVDEGMAATRNIDAELTRWFTEGIGKSLSVWIAVDDDRVAAAATILYMQFPPSYQDPEGNRVYLNSMYTRPEYRGRGIATCLMDHLIAEAKEKGVHRLWLGASRMGRRVYMKYGFRNSDEWLELTV